MAQEDLELEQRLARFEAQLDRFSLTLREWQHARDDPAQAADSLDVDRRIRALEETFDREARALRRLHEQPLKQLQAQAANLSEICIAATNSVNSLDQAEARLAALIPIFTYISPIYPEISRRLRTICEMQSRRPLPQAARVPRGRLSGWCTCTTSCVERQAVGTAQRRTPAG